MDWVSTTDTINTTIIPQSILFYFILTLNIYLLFIQTLYAITGVGGSYSRDRARMVER
jgi:hypothetical protein